MPNHPFDTHDRNRNIYIHTPLPAVHSPPPEHARLSLQPARMRATPHTQNVGGDRALWDAEGRLQCGLAG